MMAALRPFIRLLPQLRPVAVRCAFLPTQIGGVSASRYSLLYGQERGVAPSCHQIVFFRGYAKKGKKEKGGKGKVHKVDLSPEEIEEVINYDKMVSHFDDALEHLKQEYIKQLSLRTNIGAFDQLIIETDDGKFPLNQLAQIVQKNPQLIAINLGPVPQYIPTVTEALSKSGMNVNPQQDGNMIFVALPKVTREHRETLAKNAKTLCDRSKVKFRDIHNKYSKSAKKNKAVSEDTAHEVIELIHNKLHDYQNKADDLMHKKQQEILGGK
ncbi:ribosome-recycling factor, mitochondrial-like isoform X1 [Lineus longissimus]|uniref:ribosome-recycling factor, mitochondrial-like isoform X1 n=1 Tax=Lineus longissimus TaxID=88925 RepID=UPI002B4E32FA